MFLTVTLALLALLFLAGAVYAYRLPPTLENRVKALAAMLIALALGVTTPVIMPGARISEARAQAEIERLRLDAQVSQVKALSDALGSPAAYIEYLKATRDE